MAHRQRLSQHVRDTQLPGHDILENSNLQELARRGVQIPVEELTKSEQVQPWVGQEQDNSFTQQQYLTEWQHGHAPIPGAMTEPLQSRAQPVQSSATLSRHASDADSGYVSQPLSSKPRRFDFSNSLLPHGVLFDAGSLDERRFQGGMFPPGARTVVSETPVSSSSRTHKPSLAPCLSCGRLPKNHSDARKHLENHAKRHRCEMLNCGRREGFATLNDLERHRKSVHGARPTVGSPLGFICQACVQQSQGKETKFWPRRDNFKAHIKRKHADWDEAKLIEISKSQRPNDAMTADMEDQSVISAQDRPRALSCVEQSDNPWYPFQPQPYSPQFGVSKHQDDMPELFTNSQNQEDALAAVGSHAMDESMSYDPDVFSFEQEIMPSRTLASPYMSANMQDDMQDDMLYQAETLHDEFKASFHGDGGMKQIAAQPTGPTPPFRRQSPPRQMHTAHTSASASSQQQVGGEHQCHVCSKFKKRECDLKKHMKRHTRPYGCTFPSCSKTFGSRNDWSRHEANQHSISEQWKCCRAKAAAFGGQTCQQRPFESAGLFKKHLRSEDHGMTDERAIQHECISSRMGKKGFGGWWCGFCMQIIRAPPHDRSGYDSDATGSPVKTGWKQRVKHIGDHFDKDSKHIDDWVCVEENKQKRYISADDHNVAQRRARKGLAADVDEQGEEEEDLPVWEPMIGMTLENHHHAGKYGDEQDADSVSDDEKMSCNAYG